MRPQLFTTISIAVVFVLAYLWVAATLGLPLGKFAFWLLAPTTWWGITSDAMMYLGVFTLQSLAIRERKRRQQVNQKKPRTCLDLQTDSSTLEQQTLEASNWELA